MAESHDARINLNTKAVISLTGLLLLAFAASLGMAFNIDAIALSFQVSNADAGFVASAEMVAIAIGTLFFARQSGRLNAGSVYIGGVFVIVICNLLSILAPATQWLMAARVPSGLALGAVVSTVMATAGRSDQPERTFGIINAAVGLMGIAVAYILPRALRIGERLPADLSLSPVDGLYAVYICAALLALLFIRSTPRPTPFVAADGAPVQVAISGWIALGGLGLLFFGHGLLGIFMVRIGRQASLTAEQIGYVFMVAGIVGILAPLISGYLGARYPSTRLSAVMITAMLALAYVLAGVTDASTFMWSVPVFVALPTALMPVFLGATAAIDPSGRLAGSHPAFVMIGAALTPVVGGALSDALGFTANGWMAIICIAVGALMMLPVLRAADQGRAQRQIEQARPLSSQL